MDIFDITMSKKTTAKPAYISKQVISGNYLFLDLADAHDESFMIVNAGREECTADYTIERESFPYYAIEYIASGRWILSSENGEQEVGPGTIFAYSPQTHYKIKPIDSDNLVKFFVDFTGTESHQKCAAAGLVFGAPIQLMNTRWVHDIFDHLISLAHASDDLPKPAGTLLIELLLLRLQEDKVTEKIDQHPHAYTSYMRCRRFIMRHFLTIRRMEEVANHCFVDSAYLSRLFKQFSNERPYQFLTRLKINHAAELLIRNQLSIQEIASHVGYDDPYHFSRVFKSFHAVPPSQFQSRSHHR